LSITKESIAEIAEKIFELEVSHKLFDKKINGVYFWKLVRFSVFKEIANAKGLYDSSSQAAVGVQNLYKNILANFRLKPKVTDTLFVSHGRYYQDGASYKDMYIGKLIDDCKDSCSVLYPVNIESKYKLIGIDTINSDSFLFFLPRLLSALKFEYLTLNKKDKGFLLELNKVFSVAFNLSKINKLQPHYVSTRVNRFKVHEYMYSRVLSSKKIKTIYLVCSYGLEALISAAQKLSVKVVEVQHGVMSRYHLGYSFPGMDVVPYFPDEFYGFSSYWYESTPLPIAQNKFKDFGFPYVKKQLGANRCLVKKQDQVLFISQGDIGSELSMKAIQFAQDNPDVKVVYRLHPNEVTARYSNLPKFSNLHISDKSDSTSLYDYLFETEFVVGVFSTALFEALHIGCKIQLVDQPGVEYMENLVDLGITLVRGGDKIMISNFRSIDVRFF